MSTRTNYTTSKKKLRDLSQENDLAVVFYPEDWPMRMTIKPYTGVGSQLSLLENMETRGIHPDAVITMTYHDGGDVDIDISDQFRISDTLLTSFSKTFKKVCQAWAELILSVIHGSGRVSVDNLASIDDAVCKE